MEILSKDMLDLLRDSKFRETVKDLLNRVDVESKTVTVTIPNRAKQTSDVSSESHEVTIRRVSA